MDIPTKVAAAQRLIHNIATHYDETDKVISAALKTLRDSIDLELTTLPASRAANDAAKAAKAKELEDARVALAATGAPVPQPITGSLGMKV